MRISDLSSDVCSSDLRQRGDPARHGLGDLWRVAPVDQAARQVPAEVEHRRPAGQRLEQLGKARPDPGEAGGGREQREEDLGAQRENPRSEEHTSELQSLMRISYAVFCLKKKNKTKQKNQQKNK